MRMRQVGIRVVAAWMSLGSLAAGAALNENDAAVNAALDKISLRDGRYCENLCGVRLI